MDASAEKIFNNRYRVDGTVGTGGMALVYSGTDTLLRRRVAIKVLRDQYASDDDFVQRFSYEAQAAAKLSHPNIVNVYDFGTEQHHYYIVMELVDGTTLADLMRDGVLPEPVAVDYAVQIASGLAYAHRQGLLHRDVKPANILVTSDDVVKISDFGIARAVSENAVNVTQPGMVMGSVAYISPEQAQGKELDERSDLYSLGVVLYQMLTGRLPFAAETPVAVAIKHVSEPAPPIDPASGVSPALAAIVARLLRKEPEDRYSSATEVASALREARERPHVAQSSFADAPTTRIPIVQPPPRTSAAPDRPEITEVLYQEPQRFDRRLLVLPLLLLAAIAMGFFALRGPLGGAARDIAVPNLVGESSTQAQQTLFGLGLQPKVTEEESESIPQDRVIRQSPGPNEKLARGEAVALVVSGGLPRVVIPDVKGYGVEDAQRRLVESKLRSKIVEAYSERALAGQVVDVNPAVGASVRQGTIVALTVSKGAKPIAVPNVVSMKLDDARTLLTRLGLQLNVVQKTESDSIPENAIASQDPAPGSSVATKSAVSVVVSSGASAAAVPSVTGRSPEDAQAAIRSAGFEPALSYSVEAANAPGTVTAQQPAGGTNAKRGSRVTIYVNVPGTVPDVTGQSLEAAKHAIAQSGYQIGNIVYTPDGGVPDGMVVRTEPEANSALRPNESVNITVQRSP